MKHLGKNLVIVIALVAAGFFLAYLRFRPYLGQDSGYTDGERRYAGDAFRDVRFAVWEDPRPLPDSINSPAAEGRPALSPDGRWLVFPVGQRGLNTDLWIAEIVDGQPGEPRPLAGLNSERDELAPAFGAGALYFASDRGGTLGGLDLFRAEHRDGRFGAVEPVGPGVNSDYDDTDPAPLPGAAALAFASDRPRGARRDFDLYLVSLGPDGAAPRLLDGLNTPFDEREPAFVGDARALLFSSDRSGGAGGYDLYRSVADRGVWLPPEPLPGLNGVESERGPAPSADGFSLLFAVADAAGGSDLYRASSRELFPVPGRPVGWIDLAVFASLLLLALLAWLAKRWDALDLLYKCVLVAVVLHVLLLLWFRGLYPEPGGGALPDREALFRIKLATVSAPSRAANRAFGGELDSERSAVVVAAPLRSRAEPEDASPLESAPERNMARAAADVGAAPERRAVEVERSQPRADELVVQDLRQPQDRSPRHTEDAPRLSVRLDDAASHAERSPLDLDGPQRAEAARDAEENVRPDLLVQERAPARSENAPSFAPATVAPAPRDPALALALELPHEALERFAGAARAFELDAPIAVRAEPGRSTAEPERREGRAADLLAAVAGPPEMAEPRPLERAAAGAPDLPTAAPLAFETPVAERTPPAIALREETLAPPVAPGREAQPALELLALAESSPARASGPPPAAPLRQRPAADRASGPPRPDALALERAPAARDAADPPPAPADLVLASRERGLPEVALRAAVEAPAEIAARETAEAPLGLLALDALPRPERSLADGPRRRAGGAPAAVAANAEPLPAARRFERAVADPVAHGSGPSAEPGFRPHARELPSIALRGGAEPFAAAERTEAAGAELALLAPPAALARPLAPEREAGPQRWRPEQTSEEHAPAPISRPLAVAAPSSPLPLATAPVALDHTPYQNRFGPQKEVALREFGGGAETEAAVTAGLAYLARIQSGEGYWGSSADRHEKYRHVAIGKSALCLLAFLGAGHTPASGSEHTAVADRAVAFLLAVQDPATGHFGDSGAYSHGIATYALAECYALTGEPRLREPLERAVAWIVAKQVRSRSPDRDGGWGYYYPDGAVWENDTWPRVSVTSWQVMALESARLGGLEVPDRVFTAARSFLRGSVDPQNGWLRYSHDPARLRSSYPTLPASTPAGLFAASLLGEDMNEAHYARARAFLRHRAPDGYRFDGEDAFVYDATGNLYFWYYGSLASFRIGGDDWEHWNTRMKRSLLEAQQRDGSWLPISLYSRYAGDDAEDRSYTTAMCVLSLEVYYRYFTPLLKIR